MTLTTDPNDPQLGHGKDDKPGPQNEKYLVLSKEERAKGFIRPIRQSYRHTVCNCVTTMALPIAETYARNPRFYGYTYCVLCGQHLPVDEFIWLPDGSLVGS